MKRLHIACGQFTAAPGDKSRNIDAIERLTTEAAARGCQLIVFPEMATTGYLPPDQMPGLAEMTGDASGRRIESIARNNAIAVAYGFPELLPDGKKRSNTFRMVGPDGKEVGLYRKIHLWDTEAAWCDAGTDIPLFEFAGTRISGWICYDTRFPELARLAFLEGAELCLVPTAWLGPAGEWELLLRARALENAFFVAGADLINPLEGLNCRGASLIAGPHGEVLARAEQNREGIIDAVLEPATMNTQRARIPLFRDRKPDLYDGLIQTGNNHQ